VRDGRITLRVHALSDTNIDDFRLALIKYSLTTTLARFDGQDWVVVFGLLLAALVLNALVYRNQVLTQWSIVVLVLSFLAYNDVRFTLGLLGYLAVLYHSRRFVTTARNRHLLFFLLLTSVCFLLLFKYSKDVLYEIFANPGGFDLLMPIGVSYFVIRILDTQLRWYRNDSVDVTFREYVFFIIFPGTLIAGPIEDIRSFYENRLQRIRRSDVALGLSRISLGLFKKIVVADGYLLSVMNGEKLEGSLWQGTGGSVDTLAAVPEAAEGVEIFAFALSGLLFAYIDFSAYSDIAIGLSRLFGFQIRENFNFPVLAPNIREYWKRWHISLSDWSFRNVYFPALLKSQNSYLPLYLTMLSIGMWHAFNLSWFSWAMHHATGMMVVGLAQKHVPLKPVVLFWLRPLRTAATVVFASLGFVFVYFSDYATALELYLRYWRWLFSWVGF
jgi:alginate O-acetyltransferase complex protein AlgI